jgi:hypothetical protein
MTAAETYAARIDAVRAQRARLHGAPPPDDPWGGRSRGVFALILYG